MDIGTLLKDKRTEKGLTQKDVAEAVGVSEGTVSRWESGKIGNMRRDKIDALAKVLSIDPVIIAKAESQKIASNALTGAAIGGVGGAALGAAAAAAGPIGIGAALLGLFSSTKRLMDAVGVKDDNINNQQIDINNPPIFVTQVDEIKLVSQYRLLSDADKLAVRGLIDTLAQKYLPAVKEEGDGQS